MYQYRSLKYSLDKNFLVEPSIIFKVKNNIVYPVEIVITDLQDNYYIATGQIKENDIIVVDGNESLRPKQPVKILRYLK